MRAVRSPRSLGIEPTPTLQRLHAAMLRQEAELDSAPPPPVGDAPEEAARALLDGRLVLVLGAGVHAPGNGAAPPGGGGGPPRPRVRVPDGRAPELSHVAQYVAVTRGVGPLYDELHELLAGEHPLGPRPRGVAGVAAALREAGRPQPVIVTTTYDHALEGALARGAVRHAHLHRGRRATAASSSMPRRGPDERRRPSERLRRRPRRRPARRS